MKIVFFEIKDWCSHNAFNSREALVRILDTTVANLEAQRDGVLLNRVA